MVDKRKQYWDLEQCCWVPFAGAERVPVPEQAGAVEAEAGTDETDVAVAPV